MFDNSLYSKHKFTFKVSLIDLKLTMQLSETRTQSLKLEVKVLNNI